MRIALSLRNRPLRKTGFVGLLDTVPGAAAAYALHSLTKDWAFQPILKVRRSSDNAERDFTELELTDGTLLSWVNEDAVVSLNSDITSASSWTIGASTSYNSGTQAFDCTSENSLTVRQPLSQNQCVFHYEIEVSAYTSGSFRIYAGGNVSTEVVSSAGTFTGTLTGGSSNSFFGINPSSFSGSIASFTVTQQTASGHTTTWYDQSGNSRNATQTTAASQPKIVDAGTLVLSNSLPALSFDDVDDFFRFPSGLVTSDHSMLLVAEQKNTNGALLAIADVGGYYLRYTGTNPATLLWYIPDTTKAALAQVNATASQELLTFYKTATNVYSRVNGANEVSRASSGSLTTSPSAIGRYASAYYFGGNMQCFVLYATPSKGQIDSYLMAAVKNLVQTEEGVVPQWQPLSAIQSATKKFTESDFDGKNILEELHKIYIDELKGFNEGVKFTNTL